jgi:DNA-binding HxlR family transcriptional regulator
MATIYACFSGAARFNEFRQSLPGVSPTTLSERLGQLEAAGVLERQMVAGRPPHTEYTLTRHGMRLARAVTDLLENRTETTGQSLRRDLQNPRPSVGSPEPNQVPEPSE